MRLARLAVAAVSPTVGAVHANRATLVTLARAMADADVTLAAFPEQVVGGYPPEDLVQWRGFLDAQRRSLRELAARAAWETATIEEARGDRGAAVAMARRARELDPDNEEGVRRLMELLDRRGDRGQSGPHAVN